jgi:glutathione S-transferase
MVARLVTLAMVLGSLLGRSQIGLTQGIRLEQQDLPWQGCGLTVVGRRGAAMAYEFFYWPEIQGRGEFVRLALEDAGADYIDVARGLESDGRGVPAMLALMRGEGTSHIPFAPPFLRDGDVIVSHTAAILLYLGGRIGLAPTDEDGRLWTHQVQLTITDIVKEVHNSHHPIDEDMWFYEQKDQAIARAAVFRRDRMPKSG